VRRLAVVVILVLVHVLHVVVLLGALVLFAGGVVL
jgi:hypothetical protein